MLMRFKDGPPAPAGSGGGGGGGGGECQPAGSGEKVMHAALRVGDSTILASDGRCTGHPKFEGFALTINAASEAEADRVFAALSAGGQVQMPMTKTFFSPRFGMVADKFGMSWMVIVAQ
jgi:PhnB protein